MVVIIGGAKRIGAALVKAYAEKSDVVFTYHQSLPQKKKISNSKFAIKSYRLDVRDIDAIRHWAASFKSASIETLIYVSSVFHRVQVGRTRNADWIDHLDVNLKGAYFVSECFRSKMKGNGNIQFFGDVLLDQYDAALAPYAIAKAGLSQLKTILSKEWAPDIRVNEIRLGYALPPPHSTNAQKKSWLKKIPLRKFSGVDPIIEASFYLNQNEYITGISLDVAGGVGK